MTVRASSSMMHANFRRTSEVEQAQVAIAVQLLAGLPRALDDGQVDVHAPGQPRARRECRVEELPAEVVTS